MNGFASFPVRSNQSLPRQHELEPIFFLLFLAEMLDLVMLKYSDDQFYRAKVVDLIDDESHVCN